MTDTKTQEFSINSELYYQLNSKYQWFVSLRGASLDAGIHVMWCRLRKEFHPEYLQHSLEELSLELKRRFVPISICLRNVRSKAFAML